MKTLSMALLCFSMSLQSLKAQLGCTDPQANNFNASATINDGSCTYNVTNLTLNAKANLSTPLLDENSGIEFLGTGLWTFNDGGNSNDIYRIDTASGTVYQTINITNATNVDWEDITSNSQYLFIGDIGNNNGDRQNLKIYRIAKNQLVPNAVNATADIINYSYSDQTTFTSLPNANNYDCEAIIYYKDSIHLFSKNWVDKQCKHYVLPAKPGAYIAQLRESFNASCLITGASVQDGGVIALCGYDNVVPAPVYLWMLFDHKNNLFFNGNKRRFSLATALTNGQVEGVSFKTTSYGFISNERFIQSIFNIAPMLKSFSLAPYLPTTFINPKPTADFYASQTTVCKNQNVTFSDASLGLPNSWQWTFINGTPASSTLQNPVVSYATPGVYNVKLNATNANGLDSITKSSFITVKTPPQATVTPTGNISMCAGDTLKLTANNGTGLSYQWIKNGNNINGAINKTYKAKVAGVFKVQTTNSFGCTNVSAKTIITVNCREENLMAEDVLVYPNPSSETFTFQLMNQDCVEASSVQLIDITGKIILDVKVNCDDDFQFGDELNAGIYFLRITNQQFSKSLHIIKTN